MYFWEELYDLWYLKIPENDQYLKLYQIKYGDSVNYTVTGYSIEVNKFGKITPKNKTIYHYKNGSVTDKFIPELEINQTEISNIIGRSEVEYKINNNKFKIVVNVLDYGSIYAKEKLKQYVDGIIKNKNYSQLQQLELITNNISNYSYNADYQS